MEGPRFQVVDATPELLSLVGQSARQADIDEIWAAVRMTPEEAMQRGSQWSDVFVALVDGVPLCAFGVVSYSTLTRFGAPWMVGTTALDAHAKGFIRHCKHDLSAFFGEWDKLFNLVDARNTKAIRWLKWLGFTVLPPMPYGASGLPFHPFLMEIHHV